MKNRNFCSIVGFMKVIDFKTRKVIHEDKSTPLADNNVKKGIINTVPIQTYAKGKFTLAIESSGNKRYLVVYNTSSKAEVARQKVITDNVSEWMSWANMAVRQFTENNPQG